MSHDIAGVGVVHSQFWNNHDLANRVLKRLSKGERIDDAVKKALAADSAPDKRQLLAMNWKGDTAVHTGAESPAVHAQFSEQDLVAAGNTLASEKVIERMVPSARKSVGKPLLIRLILALEAGEEQGGDQRGRQAAAVRIIQPLFPPPSDACLDLRVDDHPHPLQELRRWDSAAG